jgi:NAD(P)-dependent dehydrogenase (short-subunit alcohol dehydrogenase family)
MEVMNNNAAQEQGMTAHGDATQASWLGLERRVCVVTGAGSGIGAQTARELARTGAWVAVVDRFGDAASAIAAEIEGAGGRAIGIQADVANTASVAAAAARVQAELGPCRVLVNNAAVRHRSPLMAFGLEAWNQVLSVNLTGALLCAQAFGAQMITAARGGAIINVSSVVNNNPQFDNGAYSVSKAGLGMLTRSLALELAPHRIRCNTVSPGFVITPANAASYQDPATAASRVSQIPIGRAAQPVDLANVIVFLASDRSDYVDGQDIHVDGGVGVTLMSRTARVPQGNTTA